MEFAYSFDIIVTQADQRASIVKFTLGVIDTYGQSVSEFLNEYNARLRKTRRRGIKRFWRKSGTGFTFIEVTPDQLSSDRKLPIDRLHDKATVKISNGIFFDDGYFLPAVGVSMGNTTRR